MILWLHCGHQKVRLSQLECLLDGPKAKRKKRVGRRTVIPIPPFIVDMLTAHPIAGEGINDWRFRVARQLHRRLSPVKIADLLEIQYHNYGVQHGRKKAENIVLNAMSYARKQGGNTAMGSTAANRLVENRAQQVESGLDQKIPRAVLHKILAIIMLNNPVEKYTGGFYDEVPF
jgi:hypothetical protein